MSNLNLSEEKREIERIISDMERDIRIREQLLNQDKIKLDALRGRLDSINDALEAEALDAKA